MRKRYKRALQIFLGFSIALIFVMAYIACQQAETKPETKPKAEEETEVKKLQLKIMEATWDKLDQISVVLSTFQWTPTNDSFVIINATDKTTNEAKVAKIEKTGKKAYKLFLDKPLQMDKIYYIALSENIKEENFNVITTPKLLVPGDIFDIFYSDKPLGYTFEGNYTVFRVFAPRASKVTLVIFDKYDDEKGKEYTMQKDEKGVWEAKVEGKLVGKYYGYKVEGPNMPGEFFDPNRVIADPYSIAVAQKNTHIQEPKSIILDTSYNWEGDTWLNIDHKDLVIYECHIRDLTAHPSSGIPEKLRGTYYGLIQEGAVGGINWLRNLGVNAVEFLPVQDFGHLEPPFWLEVPHPGGGPGATIKNSWNPYGRNHWGYMPTYWFAPEAYYLYAKPEYGQWLGTKGEQVKAFKDVVKTLHKNGIAVIMDVVYNHVSQYDQNPYKYLDAKYYFWLNAQGGFDSRSGCGNDFKTDRPMARRAIVDSLKYLVKEYHIDGFRFDLATMIDWQTFELIKKELKSINPNIILIAEPWGGGRGGTRDGGGYAPDKFSDRDIASWNDRIRNGIRGGASASSSPGQGIVFGKPSREEIKTYVLATLRKYGGLFTKVEHAINYAESHDNETLGDFIRIGNKDYKQGQMIEDIEKFVKLTPMQLKQNKLAALFLFTCLGPIMMHEGQEYARSKIVSTNNSAVVHMVRIGMHTEILNRILNKALKEGLSMDDIFNNNTPEVSKMVTDVKALVERFQKAGRETSPEKLLRKAWDDFTFNYLYDKYQKDVDEIVKIIFNLGNPKMKEIVEQTLPSAKTEVTFDWVLKNRKFRWAKAWPLTIDGDSYEKDDETNWLNYKHAELNKELVDYYKGLIAFRKTKKFTHTPPEDVKFLYPQGTTKSLAWVFPAESYGGTEDILVVINWDQANNATLTLPEGEWQVYADANTVSLKPQKTVSGTVEIEPISGMILAKKK